MQIIFYILVGVVLAVIISGISVWAEKLLIFLKKDKSQNIRKQSNANSLFKSSLTYTYHSKTPIFLEMKSARPTFDSFFDKNFVKLIILILLLACLILFLKLPKLLPTSSGNATIIKQIAVDTNSLSQTKIDTLKSAIIPYEQATPNGKNQIKELKRQFTEDWHIATRKKTLRLYLGESLQENVTVNESQLIFKQFDIKFEDLLNDSAILVISNRIEYYDSVRVRLSSSNYYIRKYGSHAIIVQVMSIDKRAKSIEIMPLLLYDQRDFHLDSSAE